MNFVEELKWRGMIHNIMPGTEEQLAKEQTTAYVGIDPTADSLHVGHLVSVMMMKHLQMAGHKPIFLIGGATGMIGDPSGKSLERNLLDETTVQKNMDGIRAQLSKFIDFNSDAPNAAIMVNNYDWMKNFTFLDFIREVGKHITVNYMMAKDSVKKRLSADSTQGLSFTEFTYQLVQGYDFLHLRRHYNCLLQMGGSDQWGNITTGGELIRRKDGAEAYGLTWPLMTKSDGKKFGKTESGNIWLDPKRTSPYKFYQFWLNATDEDAEKYIKIFTILPPAEIDALIVEHHDAPHLRKLQKVLAREITCLIHSPEAYEAAVEASQILFGNATSDALKRLDEDTLLAVFEGVPQYDILRSDLEAGISIVDLLADKTSIMSSKGEARRALKSNAISLNKEKVTDQELIVNAEYLIDDKFILLQSGKKNYFLLNVK
ncbi:MULTISPECIES: tyrosine--tRNA ligase [Sanguibacteroides]|uniref:Tyrosine--tRNA ligase n=1 Tax=Sanguibacteroides justesenii TaxID=1547597 RepID=A0A0C3MD01_9PORP|nr:MULTISPECIES: tyrosine--tRNA ligase [Sanguibacteroides]KIO44288.1 tyrosyl-tRNA synthetase [Sanguibacteroides justesenii]KIO45495.1 tyrosyl-tRNA synthetase [Sanguibacteroides justesenii]PXZ44781.1 tyrosine--tRNA ligase [Sanguibacteroides justesenii]